MSDTPTEEIVTDTEEEFITNLVEDTSKDTKKKLISLLTIKGKNINTYESYIQLLKRYYPIMVDNIINNLIKIKHQEQTQKEEQQEEQQEQTQEQPQTQEQTQQEQTQQEQIQEQPQTQEQQEQTQQEQTQEQQEQIQEQQEQIQEQQDYLENKETINDNQENFTPDEPIGINLETNHELLKKYFKIISNPINLLYLYKNNSKLNTTNNYNINRILDLGYIQSMDIKEEISQNINYNDFFYPQNKNSLKLLTLYNIHDIVDASQTIDNLNSSDMYSLFKLAQMYPKLKEIIRFDPKLPLNKAIEINLPEPPKCTIYKAIFG